MMIVASIVSDQYLASRRKPIFAMGFTTAFLGLLVTALADTATTTWGVVDGEDETPPSNSSNISRVYYFLWYRDWDRHWECVLYYGRGDE